MKKWIEVDIEASIDDFTTQELREELVKRQGPPRPVPALGSDEHHPLHEIFYALKFGLTERATELVKAYVCDELGVVL